MKRGIFRSVIDLQAAIDRFVIEHNAAMTGFSTAAIRSVSEWKADGRAPGCGDAGADADAFSSASARLESSLAHRLKLSLARSSSRKLD
jgi:hypothetical protein